MYLHVDYMDPRVFVTSRKAPEGGRVFVWAAARWYERELGQGGNVAFPPSPTPNRSSMTRPTSVPASSRRSPTTSVALSGRSSRIRPSSTPRPPSSPSSPSPARRPWTTSRRRRPPSPSEVNGGANNGGGGRTARSGAPPPPTCHSERTSLDAIGGMKTHVSLTSTPKPPVEATLSLRFGSNNLL